jgi:hypothetical protein
VRIKSDPVDKNILNECQTLELLGNGNAGKKKNPGRRVT